MHAVLALEVTIGILALNLERAGLNACVIAVEQVADNALVAVCLGITHVHSHEHLCPVLSLGAASTRVYLEDSVHRVFLAPQHVLEFELFYRGDGFVIESIHLFLGDEFLLVELESRVEFVAKRLDLCVALEPFLQPFDEFHLLLGTLLVVPETWGLRAKQFFFVLYLLAVDVEVAVELLGAVFHFL